MHLCSAIVCFLVFDVNSRASFQSVEHWLSEVRGNSSQYIKIYLLGNKIDLLASRAVTP